MFSSRFASLLSFTVGDITTPYKVKQEKKNFTMKLPVVNDRGGISWTPVIGIQNFHRGLFEKIKFENFDFQNQKYLTPKKYLEDLRRCKIEFWTTFVFCTKLIFQLPFELWSFEKVTF